MPGHDEEPPPPAGAIRYDFGPVTTPAEVPGLCDELGAVLLRQGAALVVCDVGAIDDPDAVTIDALARLALTARRLGGELCLYRAGWRLRELLALTGLAAVLPLCLAEPRLAEPRRQPEQREQVLGVEEGVEAGDPPG